MSALVSTRIQVGDYDVWRSMLDQDRPHAREKATAVRVFGTIDDPKFVIFEFASVDAEEARRRVVESGVLDRFEEKHGPDVLDEVTG